MRRVEQNGRPSGCPWSIRQTGVYHKLGKPGDRSQEPTSVLFLVAPSFAIDSNVLPAADGRTDHTEAVFSIHRRIVAESLMGWVGYMSWLEDELKLKSTRVMATLGMAGSRSLTFAEGDRLDLRELEEYITSMRVLLQTKIQTIRQLAVSYQVFCSLRCGEGSCCECGPIMREFDRYANEAGMYLERAGVLQDRVQSVQNLLSDLLGYEEQRTLRELMLQGVKGSTAMEQLAIIGLVFIPTTLVENFFSTEFVKADGDSVRVSRHAWLMAAVAVPMTVSVLLFWRLWLRIEFLRLRPLDRVRRGLRAIVWGQESSKEEAGLELV
ncbi:hypothetical protein BDW74DRAFT_73032 [Aspergillus multicolor]|uniref:uncharacterized protein n=1 Tax=Aspergillus multicolor TaxID=41759 RepID=UPI003CCD8D91